MNDFSLMDAIECGIVKLPRVPVADNIPGQDMPMYRNLWEHIRRKKPKKRRSKSSDLDPLSLPPQLQTALEALYGHYAKTFDLWEKSGIRVPPCFIVVCNNTSASKLVYDFISGFHRQNEDGSSTFQNGRLPLFRNFDDYGNPLPRSTTILIDSEEREAGEALDKSFRRMAEDEIARFGRALRRQSYELNEDGPNEGLFNVEYADILGVPFDFTAKPVISSPQPPRETIEVKAVRPDRNALEIRFPRVAGYRVELPNERLS